MQAVNTRGPYALPQRLSSHLASPRPGHAYNRRAPTLLTSRPFRVRAPSKPVPSNLHSLCTVHCSESSSKPSSQHALSSGADPIGTYHLSGPSPAHIDPALVDPTGIRHCLGEPYHLWSLWRGTCLIPPVHGADISCRARTCQSDLGSEQQHLNDAHPCLTSTHP